MGVPTAGVCVPPTAGAPVLGGPDQGSPNAGGCVTLRGGVWGTQFWGAASPQCWGTPVRGVGGHHAGGCIARILAFPMQGVPMLGGCSTPILGLPMQGGRCWGSMLRCPCPTYTHAPSYLLPFPRNPQPPASPVPCPVLPFQSPPVLPVNPSLLFPSPPDTRGLEPRDHL